MRKRSLLGFGQFKSAFLVCTAALFWSSAAHAVYPQPVEIETGSGEEIPTSRLSFEAFDGSEVKVEEEDDDDGGIALIFPGDKPVPGNLVIVRPDGTPIRIAVPVAGPGDTVVIDVPRRTARLDSPRIDRLDGPLVSPPKVAFGAKVIYNSVDTPSVGTGVVIDGGTEDFAALLDEETEIYSLGLEVAVPVRSGTLNIFGSSGSGDTSTTTSIPDGGVLDVGIVNTDFAPSGSTGIFLGNAGLDVLLDRDVELTTIGAVYGYPLFDGWQPSEGLEGRVGFEYKRIRQDVEGTISSPLFGPDIRSDISQTVEDEYLSLILGIQYHKQSESGLFFKIGADGMLIDHDGELESVQNVICNVCGPEDQSFTLTVRDEVDGISFGARGRAEAGVAIGDSAKVSVFGYVEHLDKVSQILNPRTGDDLFVRNQPTAIRSSSTTNYGAGLLLTIGL